MYKDTDEPSPRMRRWPGVLNLINFLPTAGIASAQTIYGASTGHVRNPSGRAGNRAKVYLVNRGTKFTRDVVAGSSLLTSAWRTA